MNPSFCKKIFLLSTLLCAGSYGAGELKAQKLALNTNALGWATLSPNIGAEVIVGSHISVNGHVTVHPSYKGNQLRFAVVQPELRYWFGRPCARHFIGITGFYMDNDIVWKNTRYKGDGFAAGTTYGYSWVLSDHWNLEASLGAGALYARQFKTDADEELPKKVNYRRWMSVPMKCALSVVYVIK